MGFLLSMWMTIICVLPIPVQDDNSLSDSITHRLERYMYLIPQKKIYLHLDKPHYMPGDDIWFKAYITEGVKQYPDALSVLLYVELINPSGKIIEYRNIKIDQGVGRGDIELSLSVTPGDYIIRAYTRFMQNYDPDFLFRKKISILQRPDKPVGEADHERKHPADVMNAINFKNELDMTFFPEGGEMVDNLVNHIAFKVSNSVGKGVQVDGVVLDSTNKQIAEIECNQFGMGLLKIIPRINEMYYSRIFYNGEKFEFPLPEHKKEGYAMHIEKNDRNLVLSVQNNMEIKMDQSFVIGHIRGTPFVNIQAIPGKDYIYSSMNTDKIPSGIAHFTFFDCQGIPTCERLVYLDNPLDEMILKVDGDKMSYTTRQKSIFSLNLTDSKKLPAEANLSVSITNTSLVDPAEIKSNIKTYLLLESDLKGTIENPAYYFDTANYNRTQDLDILMMTHGWRRFVWKDVLAGTAPRVDYSMENGFTLEGNLLKYYNQKKTIPGIVSLFMYQDQFNYSEVISDEYGIFRFDNLDIEDSTYLILQSRKIREEEKDLRRKNKGKVKDDIKILVHKRDIADINPGIWPKSFYDIGLETTEIYQEQHKYILKLDSAFDGRTIVLDEVVIEDKKIMKNPVFDMYRKYYQEPNYRILLDSMHDYYDNLSVFDILRMQVPGVQVLGAYPNQSIVFSRRIISLTQAGGYSPPLILWNGMPVDSQAVNYLVGADIECIDVLVGARGAIFGSRGIGGVIAIYTRTGYKYQVDVPQDLGIISHVHPGYYRAREFYTPSYDVPNEKHIKPDYRSTLYWNPEVITDNSGEAEFSFFTSDEKGTYCMQVEGITYNGRVVVGQYFLTVE